MSYQLSNVRTRSSHRFGPGRRFVSVWSEWADLIATWIQRAQTRRALACLDDCGLKDVGITSGQAAEEVAKPFWRA